MDYCMSVLEKWLPPITKEDKEFFYQILTDTTQTPGAFMLKEYVKRIIPYMTSILRSKEYDCLASGAVFFFGCLVYIMHFPKWGDYIDDILLYNLLYLLVDHYIDDNEMSDEIKQKSIKQMWILIQNPLSEVELVDPLLGQIASIYHKLITRRPNTKNAIIKVFEVEIEGLKIQNNPNSTREEYLDIARRKGAYSVQVLHHMLGDTSKENYEQAYLWGAVLQLVDDSIDINDDLRNKINTIGTHEIKTKGNADDLWIEIVTLIDSAKDFKIFKVIFSIFSAYLPGRYPENYTGKLKDLVKNFNMFEGCDSSSMLVNSIKNELFAQEVLN